MATTVSTTTYADAETRGKLRLWKQKLARDYAVFDGAFKQMQGGNLAPLVLDMAKSARSGRAAALGRISS
jgi:hypothetical protein